MLCRIFIFYFCCFLMLYKSMFELFCIMFLISVGQLDGMHASCLLCTAPPGTQALANQAPARSHIRGRSAELASRRLITLEAGAPADADSATVPRPCVEGPGAGSQVGGRGRVPGRGQEGKSSKVEPWILGFNHGISRLNFQNPRFNLQISRLNL